MKHFALYACIFASLFLLRNEPASAQSSNQEFMTPATLPGIDPKALTPEALAASILTDRDGDGAVEIAAFGDSITRGEGDFIPANEEIFQIEGNVSGEAGYPLRIERLLGIPVSNLGDPGERLVTFGVPRFINIIPRVAPDFVVISGGSNDGRIPIASSGEYFRGVQTMINLSRAIGIQPVLATIVPACCGHAFLTQFIDAYNNQLEVLAIVNEIPLADVHKAYLNTCTVSRCRLLNRPEGLHPNIEGYDVFGEVVISALLNINIFAPDGPALLAQAIGVPVTAIRTVPDALPAEPAPQATPAAS